MGANDAQNLPAGIDPDEQVAPISILVVQKALTELHTRDPRVLSPGTIDGRWGPHTERSFESWTATLNYAAIQPEGTYQENMDSTGRLLVTTSGYAALTHWAMSYDAAHPSAPISTTTAAPLAVRRGLPWYVWLILGLGAAGAGLGLWLYFRSRKRHRR